MCSAPPNPVGRCQRAPLGCSEGFCHFEADPPGTPCGEGGACDERGNCRASGAVDGPAGWVGASVAACLGGRGMPAACLTPARPAVLCRLARHRPVCVTPQKLMSVPFQRLPFRSAAPECSLSERRPIRLMRGRPWSTERPPPPFNVSSATLSHQWYCPARAGGVASALQRVISGLARAGGSGGRILGGTATSAAWWEQSQKRPMRAWHRAELICAAQGLGSVRAAG